MAANMGDTWGHAMCKMQLIDRMPAAGANQNFMRAGYRWGAEHC